MYIYTVYVHGIYHYPLGTSGSSKSYLAIIWSIYRVSWPQYIIIVKVDDHYRKETQQDDASYAPRCLEEHQPQKNRKIQGFLNSQRIPHSWPVSPYTLDPCHKHTALDRVCVCVVCVVSV